MSEKQDCDQLIERARRLLDRISSTGAPNWDRFMIAYALHEVAHGLMKFTLEKCETEQL